MEQPTQVDQWSSDNITLFNSASNRSFSKQNLHFCTQHLPPGQRLPHLNLVAKLTNGPFFPNWKVLLVSVKSKSVTKVFVTPHMIPMN
jgi:hypothetical protein